MRVSYVPQHLEGFLQTVRIVEKEMKHLDKTRSRLFVGKTLDENWVRALDADDALQDTLETFSSRFSRLQDTIGDKLLPRFFLLTGEKPGTFLENLDRAERLGLIDSAADWLPLRGLCNRIVHEYMENARDFADALNLANRSLGDLHEVYRRILIYCRDVLSIDKGELPELLSP